MVPSSIIYCDESGNDGPNYLNPASPFYVLAGWVVPEFAIVDASIELENLRQKHCRSAPELGFGTFKKKPWAVSASMAKLGKLGLVPLYVLAEKRYCVAGKIVETFLDPFYNPSLKMGFTYDLITKQELANTFYNRLSSASMRRFAEAYRTPTQSGLEKALEDIASECLRFVNPEIGKLIEGSRPKLGEIAAAEVTAVSSWGKGMGTLNLPCLISFLMIVEELGRQQMIVPKRIVHDEQGPYQADYLKAFAQFRVTGGEQVLINGMRVPYGAIRHIEDFEVQESIRQPLVQAADLLAGSVAHLSKALIDGRPLHQQEIDLGGLIFPALLQRNIALALPICSDVMLKKIGEAIRLAYPEVAEPVATEHPSGFKWKTNLPDGELPLFPPIQTLHAASEDVPTHKVKIDLPLFAIVNDEGNLLIAIEPDVSFRDSDRRERYVPLWTVRELAEAYLKENDWTVPQKVVAFGPREIRDLTALLRTTSEWADLVILNYGGDNCGPCPLLRLAEDMERIVFRVARAGGNGALDSLYEEHCVNGDRVGTLLLAAGEYAAMRLSDGMIATADSRTGAVEALGRLLAAK